MSTPEIQLQPLPCPPSCASGEPRSPALVLEPEATQQPGLAWRIPRRAAQPPSSGCGNRPGK